jgi:hypothetical protein
MVVNHSGSNIDATKEPLEATLLAIRASSNSGSKRNAWNWANDAVNCLKFFDESSSNTLDIILNDTRSNFPNCAEALFYVKGLK